MLPLPTSPLVTPCSSLSSYRGRMLQLTPLRLSIQECSGVYGSGPGTTRRLSDYAQLAQLAQLLIAAPQHGVYPGRDYCSPEGEKETTGS